jgi:hypothetical protein
MYWGSPKKSFSPNRCHPPADHQKLVSQYFKTSYVIIVIKFLFHPSEYLTTLYQCLCATPIEFQTGRPALA